ncbi:phosphoglycerate transporter [Clavibacter michiganensis subsp. michiganensis]|uniref:uridine kinase family protein n=1 Tax=Clavibacter michiganensis TaxID=28447 RepID=UPI001FF58147|nr:phosphoglycerate transporter [Clavibacter michiganensis]UOW04478.1 phosphoglycerate transporter [Clavibacter michiganensis subsp. michiganensis]
MDALELTRHVRAMRVATDRPLVVGVSGYGGSGKSTLARVLTAALPGSVRLRGDDFLDPSRSHRRSPDWDGVDRLRLVEEALDPLRSGRGGAFRRYDWGRRALGGPERLPETDLLVVDLIGLLHPETRPWIDLAVWCDVDLETASARGMARDARLGRDHDALLRDVWIPNERDFDAGFAPRASADVLLPDAPGSTNT